MVITLLKSLNKFPPPQNGSQNSSMQGGL